MFLVVTYVCLNFKHLKSVYKFCTEISDSIESCVHCGKISHLRRLEVAIYCSKDLYLQSYLEMLWSETGYFGL